MPRGQRSPMGGQANFYINCNFSLRTSTGILIVYEIGFPGRREVRSDLLPDLSYLYRNVKSQTSFVKNLLLFMIVGEAVCLRFPRLRYTDPNSVCYNSTTEQGQMFWIAVARGRYGSQFDVLSMLSISPGI
jgi:hypothetical protein